MKPLIAKVRPAGGFASVAHKALSAILPILVLFFVRIELAGVALAILLISKWRMLAVKPRFWFAHIRTNAVDIIVSLSFLVFITEAGNEFYALQIFWAALFMIWLIFIKPSAQIFMITLQALIGFSFGMVALFIIGGTWPLISLVVGSGIIAYAAAHHFFDAFEEKYTKLLSYIWAWFCSGVVWVLGHWLLYYGTGIIAQPALILISLGYGLAAMYYLDHLDKLSGTIARQFIFIMVAITLIILTFSDWGDKIV